MAQVNAKGCANLLLSEDKEASDSEEAKPFFENSGAGSPYGTFDFLDILHGLFYWSQRLCNILVVHIFIL